mmetsp:Transcript_26984/g.48933  ORF Transcript_26984/g.48933 Transcript_26984/m.48933 type:complete len:211 (+) Transcript_26984:2287-2919(+)
MVAGDGACFKRNLDLSDMADGGVKTVDKDPGFQNGRIVDLSHVGAVGADQVDVLSGTQPVALDQWIGGHGGACHNVGGVHGIRQFPGYCHAWTFGGHRLRVIAGPVPDGELRVRKGRSIGSMKCATDRSCAHNQDRFAVRAGQMSGRQQAVACRLPLGHQMKVDDGSQGTVRIGIEVHSPIDHRRTLARVSGKDGGGFHSHAQSVYPSCA